MKKLQEEINTCEFFIALCQGPLCISVVPEYLMISRYRMGYWESEAYV